MRIMESPKLSIYINETVKIHYNLFVYAEQNGQLIKGRWTYWKWSVFELFICIDME